MTRRTFLQTATSAAAAGVTLLADEAQAAPPPPAFGLTDQIDVARDGDEAAHAVRSTGKTARETVGDWVGGQDTRRLSRRVAGSGSAVSYRLKVRPDAPLTLEFEERYGRTRDIIAYSVYADGKKLAFRTYRGCGAGPVHHFVQMPPPGKDTITLRVVSASGAPFHLSRIWAWADFDRFFDAGGFDCPYYFAPYLMFSFTNAEADRAKLRQIKDSLAGQANVLPAFTCPVQYAAVGRAEAERRIDYVLGLADTEDLPFQLHLDTWWGSTPSGSDGKGGFWTDVPYQQVVWNVTKSRYQLSIPNQWSNTPWLSPNQPELRAYKERRARMAAAHLARRQAERRAAGKPNRLLAVNLDNEPVYWASGNAGLGSDLIQADFNTATVARAAKEGVVLAPDKSPLGFRERQWLWRDLGRYNEAIGAAVREGLGNDPAAGDIYTQAMVGDPDIQFPMLDRAYPFWETAAPASVNVGGEWNGDSLVEREAVEHQIALGRNAAVNAEAGNNAEHHGGVAMGYALGQRHYTLYNYPLDRLNIAAADVADLDRPFPPFVYTPTLAGQDGNPLEYDFQSEAWRKMVVAAENVQTGIIGNTAATAVYAATADQPGVLTYRVAAPAHGGAFTDGLFLELTGRAFVYRKTDPRVCVRVLAGDSPDGSDHALLSEVANFHDRGGFDARDRIDLSPLAKGRRAIWVRIEMHAPDLPSSVLSWCSVRHVRFALPWAADATEGGVLQDTRLRTVRRQSLLVSWRADAERALRDVPPTPRAAAQRPYDAGDYAAAHRASRPPIPTALAETQPPAPAGPVTGVFRGGKLGADLRLIPDNPDGDHSLPLTATATVTLSVNGAAAVPAALTDLLSGDGITATRDGSGTGTAVQASRGTAEGTLAEVAQGSPHVMPALRLAGDGERARILDLSAPIHLPDGKTVTARAVPLGELPLAAGERVRIRFHPATGRVYEVWKV